MKVSRSIQLAVGFVVVIGLVGLLVWGAAALMGGQGSGTEREEGGFF